MVVDIKNPPAAPVDDEEEDSDVDSDVPDLEDADGAVRRLSGAYTRLRSSGW